MKSVNYLLPIGTEPQTSYTY